MVGQVCAITNSVCTAVSWRNPGISNSRTVQRQAFFNVGIAPTQRLSSRTIVFVFRCVVDEGVVIETSVCFDSRGHRFGHIGGDACVGTSQDLFAFEVT
jgi:hypothetical protein